MSDTKNALDEIKSLEAQTRKYSLIEVIGDLKRKAKEIKKAKYYTENILKKMGYDDKDIKSIIDYINSQSSITEKDIDKDIEEQLEKNTDQAVKKIKDSYGTLTTTAGTYFSPNNYTVTNLSNANLNAVSAIYNPTPSDFNFVSALK